jgi:hypothetical protein
MDRCTSQPLSVEAAKARLREAARPDAGNGGLEGDGLLGGNLLGSGGLQAVRLPARRRPGLALLLAASAGFVTGASERARRRLPGLLWRVLR